MSLSAPPLGATGEIQVPNVVISRDLSPHYAASLVSTRAKTKTDAASSDHPDRGALPTFPYFLRRYGRGCKRQLCARCPSSPPLLQIQWSCNDWPLTLRGQGDEHSDRKLILGQFSAYDIRSTNLKSDADQG